jgi:hypothetical protein
MHSVVANEDSDYGLLSLPMQASMPEQVQTCLIRPSAEQKKQLKINTAQVMLV